jgi:hypothetical protein
MWRSESPARSMSGWWAMILRGPCADYAIRAREALAPFSSQVVDRLVAEELLPRLLA